MNLQDEDISNKSQMITLVLCVLLGRLGVHRFYVGKYITGLIFLVVGSTSIILDLFGLGYAFIAQVAFLILIAIDIYGLYSDSFTDSKGKVLGESKTLVYDNLQQREQILAEQKLNKIMCILLGVAAYIIYLVISNYVF